MRTPRNYNGTAPTGKRLSEVLPDLMKDIKGNGASEIFSFWFEVIGDKMGPMTEPVLFTEETLTVKVKSATLYSLLCQHERPRLLKELQKRFRIRSLLFRIG